MLKRISLLACALLATNLAHSQPGDAVERKKLNVPNYKYDESTSAYDSHEYIEVETPRGAVQPIAFEKVRSPIGTVILIKGGNGYVDMSKSRRAGRGNFLIRSRGLFAEKGFNTAVLYLPKDKEEMFKFRARPEHAKDVVAVANFIKNDTGLPVWVAGTSYSGVSAVNAAIHSTKSEIEGIILAAPAIYDEFEEERWVKEFERRKKSAGPEYSIMKLGLVDATAYLGNVVYLNNDADQCPTSKLKSEDDVSKLFPKAALKIVSVNGGNYRSGDSLLNTHCMGFNQHGFFEIEEQAVSKLVEAMGT